MLEPYERQVIFSGASTFGAVGRPLGLLATALHDFAAADRYFGIAEEILERFGAPTWLARTQLDHARTLLLRAEPGDRERAASLIEVASASAEQWPLGAVRQRTTDWR